MQAWLQLARATLARDKNFFPPITHINHPLLAAQARPNDSSLVLFRLLTHSFACTEVLGLAYMALRIRKDGLTQADLVQELSGESSSIEMSNDPRYQQASVMDGDGDDSFEEKPFTVAAGKSFV